MGTSKKMTSGFYEMIDLSENLDRGLRAVKGMKGLSAIVMGTALFAIVLGLVPLVWYLDIDSTRWATERAVNVMIPQLPPDLVLLVSVIAVCVSLLPSLIELFGSKFAFNIKFAGFLVFASSLFDMITDWPRVQQLMSAFSDSFDAVPLGLGFLVHWALHIPFLFLASFGFEMLAIIFAVVGAVLLVNGFMGDDQGPQQARR